MNDNTLNGLNKVLLDQLYKVADGNLKGSKLDEEAKRVDAIAKISKQIISSAVVQLKATVISFEKLPENNISKGYKSLPEIFK